MAKYRDRLQIIANLLSVTSMRTKKTRIMYQANLSYKLLCKYLTEVITAGLVNCEDGDCYVLTAKGKEFLKKHEEYSNNCKSLEKHLNHIDNERDILEKMCSTGTSHNNNDNLSVDCEERKR